MPGFQHLLTDICIVSRCIGRGTDAYAEIQYGPKERVKCAFEEAQRMVRDTDGNERVSAFVIATAVKIGLRDRVWLPLDEDGFPLEPGTVPDSSDENKAKVPIGHRNDASRRRGFRLYQTFYG